MAKRIFIYPYNQHSASAKALGFRRIKHVNSRYVHRRGDTIINWGSTRVPNELRVDTRLLNVPEIVAIAQNKLTCLDHLEGCQGINLVPFTIDPNEAKQWLEAGHHVFARTTLTGHSGAGIIDLYGRDVEVPPAPLYTKYIKKRYEFRVHVCNWIPGWNDPPQELVTQKVARPGVEPTNWHIRSHSNGFIFQEPNVPEHVLQSVYEQAQITMNAIGLHFGAVDIIWNDHQQRAYVLEVNTAPGLTGRTVDFYRNAFESY